MWLYFPAHWHGSFNLQVNQAKKHVRNLYRHTNLSFDIFTRSLLLAIRHVACKFKLYIHRGDHCFGSLDWTRLPVLQILRYDVPRDQAILAKVVVFGFDRIRPFCYLSSWQKRKVLLYFLNVRFVHHVFGSIGTGPIASAYKFIERHGGFEYVLFVLPWISKDRKGILLAHNAEQG